MISETDYNVNLKDTIMNLSFYINKNNKYFLSKTDF